MTEPAVLFGVDAGLDLGIGALCGDCPRYHSCSLFMTGWLYPERDMPQWARSDGEVVCSERDKPVPRRRRSATDLYPPGARMDRHGLPLGRYGPDGRLQVGTRENYHGREGERGAVGMTASDPLEDRMREVGRLTGLGKTARQIAVELHVSTQTVAADRRRLRKGWKPKESGRVEVPPDVVEQIVELYRSGLSRVQVGAKVDLSYGKVGQVLKAAGVQGRTPAEVARMKRESREKRGGGAAV